MEIQAAEIIDITSRMVPTKIFASEDSADSTKLAGFNDRTFQIKMIKGRQ
jgi:hypothetical protein